MSKYQELKEKVYLANLRLPKENLIKLSWGNVSERSADGKVFAIKPSGVEYEKMKANDIVIIDIESGEKIEGDLNFSTDSPTHLAIYKCDQSVKGITHTHSKWATIFAQLGKNIEVYGTTHADSFIDKIYCTKDLPDSLVKTDYEVNVGKEICKEFNQRNLTFQNNPAILVKNHGLFSFGNSADDSVNNAVIAEFVAEMAYFTELVGQSNIPKSLQLKHNQRKHGEKSYYGQTKEK